MKAYLFYSWQSNLPTINNRNFLENCIKKAVKQISANDSDVVAILDRDTKNMTGSPDIVQAIFNKIDKAKLFLCDVSFVDEQKSSPNSNVMIELGYAIKSLGWDRIICFFNVDYGDIKKLPFDINHNRILSYQITDETRKNELKRVASVIENNTNNLFHQGKLFNPVEDHTKGKIDYLFLEIAKNIVQILYPNKPKINYSTIFSEIHKLSKEKLIQIISQNWILGFYLFQKYYSRKDSVLDIFDKLLSTNYFQDSWKEIVILLNNWMEHWNDIVNPRLIKDASILTQKREPGEKYIVKDMYAENNSNGKFSVLLMRALDRNSAQVIKGGELLKDDYSMSIYEVQISEVLSKSIANSIINFFQLFDRWMEETGDEIILDYQYYKIK